MKSRLAIICLVFIVACKHTPPRRVEDVVSSFIKKGLNDPASYQSIGFQKQAYTRGDSVLYAAKERMKQMAAISERTLTLLPGQTVEIEQATRAQQEILARQKKALAIPMARYDDSIGLHISHSFRAKNAFGALIKADAEYVVYKDTIVVALDPAL